MTFVFRLNIHSFIISRGLTIPTPLFYHQTHRKFGLLLEMLCFNFASQKEPRRPHPWEQLMTMDISVGDNAMVSDGVAIGARWEEERFQREENG